MLWPLVHGSPAGDGVIRVIGGAGTADALIVAPVPAMAWTALWRALADLQPDAEGTYDHLIMEPIRRLLGHRAPYDTKAWMFTGWGIGAAMWAVLLLGSPA